MTVQVTFQIKALGQELFRLKFRPHSSKPQHRQYFNLIEHWTYILLRYLTNKQSRSQTLHFVSVSMLGLFSFCGTITKTHCKQANVAKTISY